MSSFLCCGNTSKNSKAPSFDIDLSTPLSPEDDFAKLNHKVLRVALSVVNKVYHCLSSFHRHVKVNEVNSTLIKLITDCQHVQPNNILC